jgi:hypothetical protein
MVELVYEKTFAKSTVRVARPSDVLQPFLVHS